MTDHRRRAEDLVKPGHRWEDPAHCRWYQNSARGGEWCDDCKRVEAVASALKEVEEETFARAVEAVEGEMWVNPSTAEQQRHNRTVQKALTALREEAAKK